MAQRPSNSLKLYEYTVFVGLREPAEPHETGQAIHDVLVGAGFDISNAVFGTRVTKAEIEDTLKEAGIE